LSAWRAVARRWLALPPPRCRALSSCEWVALSDGTRLATRVTRPAGGGAAPLGTLLVRSDEIVHAPRRPLPLLAALLAEQGLAVVLQECRGLRASEGEFTPFVHEASDGADALGWLAKQPWFTPPLALAGFGYGGYAAFAALSRSPLPAERLVVGYAARDPYAWLHAGGALRLSATFEQAFALGAAQRDAPDSFDVERALRHRPVREADRVGMRRLDWLREWLDHPRRDDFWESRVAALPAHPPETLLLAGFGHPALAAQLADREALSALAATTARGSVALEIRPGSAPTRRQALALLADALRAAHGFVRSEPARRRSPVRVFEVRAGRWRESATWPLPGATSHRLYLRGEGLAQGAEGDGRLDAAPPGAAEPCDVFVYDPADATPSAPSRALRGDVLCYASAALAAPLALCGSVRAELHVASDAPVTDFSATLVEVDAAGFERPICDGIARVEREAGLASGAAQRVVVDCDAACWRVAAGSLLRLDIASASHPRFDRAPNTREEPARAGADAGVPARQTVFHDAARASCLILESLETAGPP
jgi:putative CocE/NonD family hydrolase